jgi:hypothetical protein
MRDKHRMVPTSQIGSIPKAWEPPLFFANRQASIELKKVYNQSDEYQPQG